jgi:1,4-dihydroxy-2-naphthoate polyprenyltransferase
MATLAQWVEGARPRTLPAAGAPVVIGTGAAYAAGQASAAGALLALLVAVSLQVGANYANDYSDGVRGTDNRRVGPVRLIGQGLAKPADVKAAAYCCFAFAGMCGLGLCALANTFWILIIGAAAIAAAWFYTGGKKPYGYHGLGELFVFVFFGLVAVLGTQFTQALRLTGGSWFAAIAVGLLSCAILMINNIRDIPGDWASGKKTFAVWLGDKAARATYQLYLAGAILATVLAALYHRGALAGLLAFALAVAPVRTTRSGAKGKELIPVLAETGRLTLAYGLLTGLGMAILSQPLLR